MAVKFQTFASKSIFQVIMEKDLYECLIALCDMILSVGSYMKEKFLGLSPRSTQDLTTQCGHFGQNVCRRIATSDWSCHLVEN